MVKELLLLLDEMSGATVVAGGDEHSANKVTFVTGGDRHSDRKDIRVKPKRKSKVVHRIMSEKSQKKFYSNILLISLIFLIVEE